MIWSFKKFVPVPVHTLLGGKVSGHLPLTLICPLNILFQTLLLLYCDDNLYSSEQVSIRCWSADVEVCLFAHKSISEVWRRWCRARKFGMQLDFQFVPKVFNVGFEPHMVLMVRCLKKKTFVYLLLVQWFTLWNTHFVSHPLRCVALYKSSSPVSATSFLPKIPNFPSILMSSQCPGFLINKTSVPLSISLIRSTSN